MSGVENERQEGELTDSDTLEEEETPQEIKKQPAQHCFMVSNPPVTTATSKNIFPPSCSRSGESVGNTFLDEGIKKRKLHVSWMDCKPRVRFIDTDYENNENKMPLHPNQSNRVIWDPVLPDQIKTSGVESFSMAEKLSRNKGRESGDYSRANEDDRSILGDKVKPGKGSLLGKGIDLEKPAFQLKSILKKKSMFDRPGKRSSVEEELHLPNVTEGSSVEDVTYYISTKLPETKVYLIRRAVQVLGQAKALHLLKKTQNIEISGGMMIMDGSRRHTPGGVYLLLLKNDKEVSKEQREYIFEEENPLMKEENTYMKEAVVKIDRGRSDFKEGEREKREPDDFSQLAHEVKAAKQKAKEKPVADGGNANAISLDDVLELDADEEFVNYILREADNI